MFFTPVFLSEDWGGGEVLSREVPSLAVGVLSLGGVVPLGGAVKGVCHEGVFFHERGEGYFPSVNKRAIRILLECILV